MLLRTEALLHASCISSHASLSCKVDVWNLFQSAPVPLPEEHEPQYKQQAEEADIFHHVLASLSLVFPISILLTTVFFSLILFCSSTMT